MTLEVVAVLGPTASGKSAFSIELALELARIGVAAEIVNGDAMQLYRHLNIGTAKTTLAERQGIPHHLLDIIEPAQEFTANEYRDVFDDSVNAIIEAGRLPVLVGGSMFYISAALDELDFSPTDSNLRAELEARVAKDGINYVVNELQRRDPASLAYIPSGNIRRLVRALEVNLLTGAPYRHSLPTPKFRRKTMQIGLSVERQTLVERIDQRVLAMWRGGLLDEVRGLRENQIHLGRTAAVAIGYKQALAQLSGSISESQAISETQQLTRRYARRQMSWFRRDNRTVWLANPDAAEVANQIRLAL